MTEENVVGLVENALNPEEFDVLAYLDEQPVATDTVEIYTNVAVSKQVSKLLEKRDAELIARQNGRPNTEVLGLDAADEDTIFDDEINELMDVLEQTKLVIELKTVSPALEESIKKHYIATRDRNATPEQQVDYEEKMYADILARAIAGVTRGDGVRDTKPWDAERLDNLKTRLYAPQREKLLGALAEIVYAGGIIESALTVDFS